MHHRECSVWFTYNDDGHFFISGKRESCTSPVVLQNYTRWDRRISGPTQLDASEGVRKTLLPEKEIILLLLVAFHFGLEEHCDVCMVESYHGDVSRSSRADAYFRLPRQSSVPPLYSENRCSVSSGQCYVYGTSWAIETLQEYSLQFNAVEIRTHLLFDIYVIFVGQVAGCRTLELSSCD